VSGEHDPEPTASAVGPGATVIGTAWFRRFFVTVAELGYRADVFWLVRGLTVGVATNFFCGMPEIIA
jgi:hypothetical protein